MRLASSCSPSSSIALLGVLAAVASLVVACGESTPPPKEPEVDTAPSRPIKSGIKTSSELGSIDEAQTKQAFRNLSPKFLDCQKARLDAVPMMTGNVKFFVRIGADGHVKWAYLSESDLGDRETEKCLLRAVSDAAWPQPDGGEAEVQYAMELPQNDTRDPIAWSTDKVSSEAGDMKQCTGGARGYEVTLYVKGTSKGGKVIGCGVAVPAKDGDDKADCICKAAKDMKLPSPGGWPAKVTLKL